MDFVVTRKLDAHHTVSKHILPMQNDATFSPFILISLQVVKQFYSTGVSHIKEDMEMSLGFVDEQICLEIPKIARP